MDIIALLLIIGVLFMAFTYTFEVLIKVWLSVYTNKSTAKRVRK